MKIKVFHIRLTKENLQTDQEILNEFLDQIIVKKTATELIQGQTNFWSILVFYEEKKQDERLEKSSKKEEKFVVADLDQLSDDEQRIFQLARQWRQDKAATLNMPIYMICHNVELMTIAKLKPKTLEDLSQIKGFGAYKIATFGEDILAFLNSVLV